MRCAGFVWHKQLSPVLLFLTFILSGCSFGPSVPSVVVYTSVDQVYAEPILKSFESATGIKVLAVYDVEAAKTTGLTNRLIAEARDPQADVFWNGEFSQTLVLQERGLLAPYHSPGTSGLPPGSSDAGSHWTAIGGRARVLVVNTRLVKRGDYPQSIFDLLDPKWPADKIGIANPLFGTSRAQAAALYAQAGPAQGRDFYARLKARGVRVLDGNAVVRDLVGSGQLMIGWTDSDDACGGIDRGAEIAVIVPDQDSMGTLVIPSTAGIVAGAPHQEQAKRLIDFLAGPEAEKMLVESGFSQYAPRNPSLRSRCMAVDRVRRMGVGFTLLQSYDARIQSELTDIFMR